MLICKIDTGWWMRSIWCRLISEIRFVNSCHLVVCWLNIERPLGNLAFFVSSVGWWWIHSFPRRRPLLYVMLCIIRTENFIFRFHAEGCDFVDKPKQQECWWNPPKDDTNDCKRLNSEQIPSTSCCTPEIFFHPIDNSKKIKMQRKRKMEKSVHFFTIVIIYLSVPLKSPTRPPVDPKFVSSANNPTARTPTRKGRKARIRSYEKIFELEIFFNLPQIPETPWTAIAPEAEEKGSAITIYIFSIEDTLGA